MSIIDLNLVIFIFNQYNLTQYNITQTYSMGSSCESCEKEQTNGLYKDKNEVDGTDLRILISRISDESPQKKELRNDDLTPGLTSSIKSNVLNIEKFIKLKNILHPRFKRCCSEPNIGRSYTDNEKIATNRKDISPNKNNTLEKESKIFTRYKYELVANQGQISLTEQNDGIQENLQNSELRVIHILYSKNTSNDTRFVNGSSRQIELNHYGSFEKPIRIMCPSKDLTIGWLYSEFIRKVSKDKSFDIENFCYLQTTSNKHVIDHLLIQYNREMFEIPHNTILTPIFRQNFVPTISLDTKAFTLIRKKSDIETQKSSIISSNNKIQYSDFEYLRFLGEGGFAKIYLVRSKITGKMYAMKVILKKCITLNLVGYLENELKINRIFNCPFICKVYTTFFSENAIHILMEYCAGSNMYEILRQKKTFKFEHAMVLFCEL